jgi:hypothetical protein
VREDKGISKKAKAKRETVYEDEDEGFAFYF